VSVVALAGLAALGLILTSTTTATVYSKDLLQDYVAARAIVDRADPYLTTAALSARYTPAATGPSLYPTPHPPTALLLFVPFTGLDFVTTLRVWIGLEVICLALSLALLLRDSGARPGSIAVLVGTAALFLWYPVFEDVGVGQLMIPLLLCLTLSRAALVRKRSAVGGGLLGLALLIKPVPWPVLVVLAWRREWRALATAILTVLAGYVAATVAMGADRVVYYFTRVLPLVSGGFHALSRNLSLWTLGWRLFSGTRSLAFGWVYPGTVDAPPIVDWPTAAGVVSVLVPLAVLAAAALLARRQSHVSFSLGVMICASLVSSPTFWNCYLVLLGLPLSTIAGSLRHRPVPRRLVVAIALCLLPTCLPYFAVASIVAPSEGLLSTGTSTTATALLTMLPTLGVLGLGWLTGRMGSAQPLTAARTPRILG
jgi:hypothetical protein